MAKQIRFPNRLGKMRTERGWSQEFVAASIGMTWRHYFRIEAGQAVPSAHNLRKLAKVFGCSMEELFDDRAG